MAASVVRVNAQIVQQVLHLVLVHDLVCSSIMEGPCSAVAEQQHDQHRV